MCVCARARACVGTFSVSSSSMDSISPKFIVIHGTEVRGSQLTAKLNEGEGRVACRDTKLSWRKSDSSCQIKQNMYLCLDRHTRLSRSAFHVAWPCIVLRWTYGGDWQLTKAWLQILGLTLTQNVSIVDVRSRTKYGIQCTDFNLFFTSNKPTFIEILWHIQTRFKNKTVCLPTVT